MNILHYIVSWYLTADFPSPKQFPCRNESSGVDGICTFNSSCLAGEIIGICSKHAFKGVCCKIPRLGDIVPGNVGFVSREMGQNIKESTTSFSFEKKFSDNHTNFRMEGKHEKRHFVSSKLSSGERKPVLLNSSPLDETSVLDLSRTQASKFHSTSVQNSFRGKRIHIDKYFQPVQRQNALPRTVIHKRPVVSNSSCDQKRSVADHSSQDQRTPETLDSFSHQREPVVEHSSRDQRSEFLDSSDNQREPVVEHLHYDQKTTVVQNLSLDERLLATRHPSLDFRSLMNRDPSFSGRQLAVQDLPFDQSPSYNKIKPTSSEALTEIRAQHHDLPKPVVQASDHGLRTPVVKTQGHDLRKPGIQAQDHNLRIPVKSEALLNPHRQVLPEESHDLRWPVLEEDSHDMRLPVGNFHGHQNLGDESSLVNAGNREMPSSVTSLSETEMSNMWPPFEFRDFKIFSEYDYLINDLSGKDTFHAYPDISKVCGRSKSKVMARLVGGIRSNHLQWPWMVSLRIRPSKKKQFWHRCGATLLNPFWVITAAHCVEGKLLDNMQLRLGEYRVLSDDHQSSYVERGIRRMVPHPSFDPDTYENDLALLHLDEPIHFDDSLISICLPMRWDDEDLAGRMAVVTGWGRLSEGGRMPKTLHEVHLPILTNKECQKMYAEAGSPENIREVFICAGYPSGGFDTCDGDSGGPLMVMGDEGEWNLVGIVSWGKACAAPKQPGVYTRLTKFIDWIIETITF